MTQNGRWPLHDGETCLPLRGAQRHVCSRARTNRWQALRRRNQLLEDQLKRSVLTNSVLATEHNVRAQQLMEAWAQDRADREQAHRLRAIEASSHAIIVKQPEEMASQARRSMDASTNTATANSVGDHSGALVPQLSHRNALGTESANRTLLESYRGHSAPPPDASRICPCARPAPRRGTGLAEPQPEEERIRARSPSEGMIMAGVAGCQGMIQQEMGMDMGGDVGMMYGMEGRMGHQGMTPQQAMGIEESELFHEAQQLIGSLPEDSAFELLAALHQSDMPVAKRMRDLSAAGDQVEDEFVHAKSNATSGDAVQVGPIFDGKGTAVKHSKLVKKRNAKVEAGMEQQKGGWDMAIPTFEAIEKIGRSPCDQHGDVENHPTRVQVVVSLSGLLLISVVCSSVPQLALWLTAIQAMAIFGAGVRWEEDQIFGRGWRALAQLFVLLISGCMSALLTWAAGAHSRPNSCSLFCACNFVVSILWNHLLKSSSSPSSPHSNAHYSSGSSSNWRRRIRRLKIACLIQPSSLVPLHP